MKELFPMYGIITTVLTPFNEDKSIDLPSFRKGIQADSEVTVVLAETVVPEVQAVPAVSEARVETAVSAAMAEMADKVAKEAMLPFLQPSGSA